MKFIIGPCVIESGSIAHETGKELRDIEDRLKLEGFDVEIIYKSSFKKANRTSGDAYRGVTCLEGMGILEEVSSEYSLKVTSDVHSVEDINDAGDSLDVIQIPHSLCRYTEIIEAAAKTGQTVSLKKGLFMTVDELEESLKKVLNINEDAEVILLERGNSFGYNDQIIDFNNINKMQHLQLKYGPNVLVGVDVSHSSSGIDSMHSLAFAAVAQGIDVLFLESHPRPSEALCDGKRSYPMDRLEEFLRKLCHLDNTVRRLDRVKPKSCCL